MDEATRLALLIAVRNMRDITWEDAATDQKLMAMIDNGVAYLNDKLGETGNYLSPGYPRSLLFEYVRYGMDAALDVFENNYQSLILAMQHNRKVAAYELESAEPTDA